MSDSGRDTRVLGTGRLILQLPVRLVREPRPVRFLLSRALWSARLTRRLMIRFPEGYQLRFHPSAMSALLWVDRDHNLEDRRVIADHAPHGGVVVDVGANVGALTIAAAWTVGPSGRVIAIEPHPRIFSYLRDNVRLNRLANVQCIQVAASATRGSVRMAYRGRSDEQNTVDAHGAVAVEASPLDDLIPDDVEVDLLKLDVEGYELLVLQGAKSTLTRTRGVYLEVWDEHFKRFGYRTSDVLVFLRDQGFEILRPGGEPLLTSSDDVGVRCENLLALRSKGPRSG